jgi:hypothetical protein
MKNWRLLFTLATVSRVSRQNVVSINMLPHDILIYMIENFFTENNYHLGKVSKFFKLYIDKINKRSTFEKASIFYKANYHIFISKECEMLWNTFMDLYNKYKEIKTNLAKIEPHRIIYISKMNDIELSIEKLENKLKFTFEEIEYIENNSVKIQKKCKHEHYVHAWYADYDYLIEKYKDYEDELYILQEKYHETCVALSYFDMKNFDSLQSEVTYFSYQMYEYLEKIELLLQKHSDTELQKFMKIYKYPSYSRKRNYILRISKSFVY